MARKVVAAVAAGAVLGLACWFGGCGGSGESAPITEEAGSPPDGPRKSLTGANCGNGGECTSGFCVDGVCCESACGGLCETCGSTASPGRCVPIPSGEDPAGECRGNPSATGDGGIAPDDAGDDAQAVFTPPAGGVALDNAACAGKCNGQRACTFPAREKSCGPAFCTTPQQEARAACNGGGTCALSLASCDGGACADQQAGCKTSCQSPADCQPTHYCGEGQCKPRLVDGIACTSPVQCASGFCASGVCCNSACEGFPGATCTAPGSIGTCRCSACANGPCRLYYRDADGDGFGDKDGTIANGRAVPGCITGPDGGAAPPAGFVADDRDCYDQLATVKPGQTQYFDVAYGPSGSFDYDCNNLLTKEIPEYPGASCGFAPAPSCSATPPGSCTLTSTCAQANQVGYLGARTGVCLLDGGVGFRCVPVTNAFTTSVACGATGSRTTCGRCAAAGGTAAPGTIVATTQRCR